MTDLNLKVGDKVKLRCGEIAEVAKYDKSDKDYPFYIEFEGRGRCWHTKEGISNVGQDNWDIVEVLGREKESKSKTTNNENFWSI